METKTDNLRSMARQLKLAGISNEMDDLLVKAQKNKSSFVDFALHLLGTEIEYRNRQNLIKRMKAAKLPANNDLNLWKDNQQKGISKQQVAQLRECLWLEQKFNIVLMGPSGTGKTFIAAGLCNEALQKGYRACFRTMEQLNYVLKMKDITKSAAREYACLMKADLLVADDIMMFPMEKKQAVSLFNLVDHLHQNASMIVTTNKSPDEWVKVLDDEVLATAILDRLLYKCEIVKLFGKSFRLDNRKTIF
ncbi:MAG: IS21-like element helper ATPase IstB [Bacteroidales bacterium]